MPLGQNHLESGSMMEVLKNESIDQQKFRFRLNVQTKIVEDYFSNPGEVNSYFRWVNSDERLKFNSVFESLPLSEFFGEDEVEKAALDIANKIGLQRKRMN